MLKGLAEITKRYLIKGGLTAVLTVSLSLSTFGVAGAAAKTPSLKGMPPTEAMILANGNHSATDTLPGLCYYGGCYYYVGARQETSDLGGTVLGARATFTQAAPKIGANDYHSLIEMSAETSDNQQVVEVGWIVDPGAYADTAPHLFVYHWINGAPTCYNSCGFVPLPTTSGVQVGDPLTPNTLGGFKLQYYPVQQQWRVYYKGLEIGYFPESLWNGNFTSADEIQTFGEVDASNTTLPKTEMGNGLLGTQPGAARITDYELIGTDIAPDLTPYVIGGSPTTYTDGSISATGMRLGGPGY